MKKSIIFTALFFLFSVALFGAHKKIVVNLTKQEAYAYENGTLLYSGWITSGRKKFATPAGRYHILQKDKNHISNEWPRKEDKRKDKKRWSKKELLKDGGAKMPYMMRLTWSGISLHAGHVANRPLSHGCIRTTKKFAQKLFKWVRVGTLVIVKGKTPDRVARTKRSFYHYLAKCPKEKMSKKRRLILQYAKLTHKRLNRILRKEYRKKKTILASKMSRWKKINSLKRIKNFISIIQSAKKIKYAARKRGELKAQKLKVKSGRYRVKKVAIL